MMLPTEQPRVADVPALAYADRLRRLEAAIAGADERARRFRSPREETEMLLMRRPLTTERAYAHFGLLLGALPPAAILFRLLWLCVSGGRDLDPLLYLLPLGLIINFICAWVGRRMGRRLAAKLDEGAQCSWFQTIFRALAAGFVWACITGAAGGGIVFGIGALWGIVCAVPFGLVCFPLFAICHRLLARGGMIDARHFWPVACGITLAGAALILSPGLFPY